MCDDSNRQDGEEKGVPQIEVTPEMIEAGVDRLRLSIGESRWIDGDADCVTKIFVAMTAARLRSRSRRSQRQRKRAKPVASEANNDDGAAICGTLKVAADGSTSGYWFIGRSASVRARLASEKRSRLLEACSEPAAPRFRSEKKLSAV